MKLNELEIPTTTTFELIRAGAQTGVYVTAYTPDSKQWRAAQRKFSNAATNLSMRVGKKGGNTIDLPPDPKAYEKRIELLAAVVTNITGIEDWEYSEEAALQVLSNDGCAWMLDSIEDQLEDRANFLENAETTAKSGSSVTVGSRPKKIANG